MPKPIPFMQAINPNNILISRLTIRVSRNSLCFSVVDNSTEQQVCFEPYTVKSGISIAANLRQAFKESSLLQQGYKKVRVYLDTPVLLMPLEEFREEEMETLYHHTFTSNENDCILYRVQPALNAVAVFPINKDLKMVVEDNFQDVRFTPILQPVWNHLYQRSLVGMHHKLYGYFHDKRLEIFSFEKNRFKFFNSYDTSNAKDSLFFLLNVWQQLGLDQRKDELHLVGDLPEREWLIENLKEYIAKVFVINPTGEFNRAPITQIKGMTFDLMTLYIN